MLTDESRHSFRRVVVGGDERLAGHVAVGSARAFAVLYERYYQSLYRFCRSILRDEADSQDAVQSAFARAFQALQRGRRDAPLRPWLFRIAHNEAISMVRRRAVEDRLCAQLERSAGSTEDSAAERERLRSVLADLRELPERQRGAPLPPAAAAHILSQAMRTGSVSGGGQVRWGGRAGRGHGR